jgi:preprotein translocase subunit SecA
MTSGTSNPALARQVAGHRFRRADYERDERAAEPLHKVEDFLRNLVGWLPPGLERPAAIARLESAVAAETAPLRAATDAEIAARFALAVRELRALTRPEPGPLAVALACVSLASQRQLGMQPYPVQCAATRALLAGRLAEMQTGEGKTLVAAMAATVMAGSGAAVHVISTNDYLARRDSETMAPLFAFFGLGVGCIQGGMSAPLRRAAYAHPICYVAGKEVVFDYLKDRLAGHGLRPARVAQVHDFIASSPAPAAPSAEDIPTCGMREGAACGIPAPTAPSAPLIPALHYAIVDEADSVLIDEARTPMILSRQAPQQFTPALLEWAIESARRLEPEQHFRIGAGREVDVLPSALARALPLPPGTPGAWQATAWREQLLRQAISAIHLFHRDQHYIVAEDKVQIVDESTGRVMADRSWEQGLHQLIETKEELPLTQGRETLARMTYQGFFRRYYLVCGLTGTAAEAARELWQVYRLRVHRIPPHRPKRVRRLPSRCLAESDARWQAVADSAIAAAGAGQAVLVGTRSVQASEQLSAELQRRGMAHVVLNARQDAEEARIVAEAGQSGRITVATNMAGRGTDIKLDAQTLAAGGLHVILTEFHESPRVDRQLFGRSARQGEPGSVQAIVSATDNLFDKQPALLKRLAAGTAGLALRLLVARAQRQAERRAQRIRLQTLRHDRELHRLIGFAGKVT